MELLDARAEPTETAIELRSAATLTRFFDPEAMSAAIEASGWTADSEAALLVGIATNPNVDPKERRAAATDIRKNMVDALRLSGRLAALTATATTTDPDGTRRTLTGDALVIARGASEATEAFLRSTIRSRVVTEYAELPAETPIGAPTDERTTDTDDTDTESGPSGGDSGVDATVEAPEDVRTNTDGIRHSTPA